MDSTDKLVAAILAAGKMNGRGSAPSADFVSCYDDMCAALEAQRATPAAAQLTDEQLRQAMGAGQNLYDRVKGGKV